MRLLAQIKNILPLKVVVVMVVAFVAVGAVFEHFVPEKLSGNVTAFHLYLVVLSLVLLAAPHFRAGRRFLDWLRA